jgi:MFS transporter, ACS family, hexuronate transporter
VALTATLTMTVSVIDRSTLAVLAPTVTKELQISESAYGWLAGSFSIAYLLMAPVSGRLIDRIGARRGLLGSLLVWSTVAALHAVAPSFGFLVALRVALGLAEAPSFPGTAQTVQRVLSPSDRSRGFGVVFSGSSIGGLLAAPVASKLFTMGGWRFAFAGTAAAGLLWVPLWLAMTSRLEVRAHLDQPASSPLSESATRSSFRELLTHPATLPAVLVVVSVSPMVGFMQAWAAKLLVARFAVAQGNIGHYLWLPPLAIDAGALVFGDLAARTRKSIDDPPRALFAVAALLVTAIALIPYASTPWQTMAVGAVASAGGGAAFTLITTQMLGRMPPGSISAAGGILAASQSIAFVTVNPLIGAAVQRYHDYGRVAMAAAVCSVPGTVFWWVRAGGGARVAAGR